MKAQVIGIEPVSFLDGNGKEVKYNTIYLAFEKRNAKGKATGQENTQMDISRINPGDTIELSYDSMPGSKRPARLAGINKVG